MKRFAYVRPGTLEDAMKLVTDDAPAYAGGIDLLDLMKERIATPRRLVDLKGGALDGHIKLIGNGADRRLRIGALATLSQVAENELVNRYVPALARSVAEAATPQLRNMATIAGNLCQRPRCWYFRSRDFNCLRRGGRGCFAQEGENRYHAVFGNDLCAITHPSNAAPALVAYRAALAVTGGETGETRTLPIEGFFVTPDVDAEHENGLKPGELITEIQVPVAPVAPQSAYLELREKESNDWALTSVTVVLAQGATGVREASLVLGHVAPVPWRASGAEAYLRGKTVTPDVAEKAGELAAEGATPLAQNGYKVQLIRVLVKRALLNAVGR
jgi:xanthine dehydrogenase YagS FAD-binding subunit